MPDQDKIQFETELNKQRHAHAEILQKGVEQRFYHARAGQYGKDLEVFCELKPGDNNRDGLFGWADPSKVKGAKVLFYASGTSLLSVIERQRTAKSFAIVEHAYIPTWKIAEREHMVVWTKAD